MRRGGDKSFGWSIRHQISTGRRNWVKELIMAEMAEVKFSLIALLPYKTAKCRRKLYNPNVWYA